MMPRLLSQAWVRLYALPSLVLFVVIAVVTYIGDRVFDIDLDLVAFMISPLLLALIGYILRPPRIWVIPAISVVAFWLLALAVRGWEHASMIFALVLVIGLPWTAAIWIGKMLHERRAIQQGPPHTGGPQPA